MHFDVSNAPNTFMRLMNAVLMSFLGKFVVLYFDGILMYSHDEVSYVKQMTQIFQVLR